MDSATMVLHICVLLESACTHLCALPQYAHLTQTHAPKQHSTHISETNNADKANKGMLAYTACMVMSLYHIYAFSSSMMILPLFAFSVTRSKLRVP